MSSENPHAPLEWPEAPPKIAPETVREWLIYYPETGLFRWRQGGWGPRKEGEIAGTQDAKSRYVKISVEGRLYFAHRLAFLYMLGRCPRYIDHVNGDGRDNRWCNLRPATHSQNCANGKLRKSISGVRGVRFRPDFDKWVAQIRIGNRMEYLGSFATKQEAVDAFRVARLKEFGEFGERL
jgi:hypothetical protein